MFYVALAILVLSLFATVIMYAVLVMSSRAAQKEECRYRKYRSEKQQVTGDATDKQPHRRCASEGAPPRQVAAHRAR